MSAKRKPSKNVEYLNAWLDRHSARCLWEAKITGGLGWIEAWVFPETGRIALIMHYGNGHGWNVYTDGDTHAIDGTLLDAERRLGLVR